MPDPISTISLISSIWRESQPLRAWIWGKLPGVKDAKSREVVEQKLAVLLDDANKLAQSLPASTLDSKLQERVDLFRQDLLTSGIKESDVSGLVDRATVLVRLMVTGPFQDLLQVRRRMAEGEAAMEALEKASADLVRRLEESDKKLNRIEQRLSAQSHLLMVAITIGALAVVVALLALVTRR